MSRNKWIFLYELCKEEIEEKRQRIQTWPCSSPVMFNNGFQLWYSLPWACAGSWEEERLKDSYRSWFRIVLLFRLQLMHFKTSNFVMLSGGSVILSRNWTQTKSRWSMSPHIFSVFSALSAPATRVPRPRTPSDLHALPKCFTVVLFAAM